MAAFIHLPARPSSQFFALASPRQSHVSTSFSSPSASRFLILPHVGSFPSQDHHCGFPSYSSSASAVVTTRTCRTSWLPGTTTSQAWHSSWHSPVSPTSACPDLIVIGTMMINTPLVCTVADDGHRASYPQTKFITVVLGDLHLSPDNMTDHHAAQQHINRAVSDLQRQMTPNTGAGSSSSELSPHVHVVSVGDLGAYGIAGTLNSFKLAQRYLQGFHRGSTTSSSDSVVQSQLPPPPPPPPSPIPAPYAVITGNHDLEAMEEYATDQENLQVWASVFSAVNRQASGKEIPEDLPVFRVDVGGVDRRDRGNQPWVKGGTVFLGLSTTRFRDAVGSSHEVFIDDQQLEWFEDQLREIQAWNQGKATEDQVKVFVYTHAPPMGCGLRAIQNVHVKNMCAWLNHSSGRRRRRVFMKLVRRYPCIKAWFSGHFHLAHDFQDSINVVNGSCTFVQCGVIGTDSARDARRQTRIVTGDSTGFQIYSVNHHLNGSLRLDATVQYKDDDNEAISFQHASQDLEDQNWFRAFTPREQDGCYLYEEERQQQQQQADPSQVATLSKAAKVSKICWWHMKKGQVLGVHDGMLLEYDEELLAPIGVVMTKDELQGRDVFVIREADALIVWPPRNGADVEVIHPNPDGSYARTYQINKKVRTERKQREELAKLWLQENKHALS